jgi:hypothetical protein
VTEYSDKVSFGSEPSKISPDREVVELQVFGSFEELSPLRQEWDQFIESIQGEIFLTYDWCRLWWKYYGRRRKLKIFIFKSEAKIVAILPVFLEKIWLGPIFAKIVKIVGTDFMPVTITIPVKEDFLDLVFDKFIDELSSRLNWDILYIGAICGRYSLLNDLLATINKKVGHSHRVESKANDVQTYFSLYATWQEQFASLSKKHRENMRRAYRLVEREGKPLISTFASNGNLTQYFEEFVRLHQSRWQGLGQSGHFTDWPLSYEFHKEASDIQLIRGRLRLLKINLGDRCLGYKYGYRVGETFCSFLTGRGEKDGSSKIEFNRIAFGEQAKKAISEGAKLIDGMRGRYTHKIEVGGKLLPIKNIYVYPKSISYYVRIVSFRSVARTLDICYSKIWRRRVAPRLGRNPRPQWDIWIRTHMLSL